MILSMEIETSFQLKPDQLVEWRRFLAGTNFAHARQDPDFASVERMLGHVIVFAVGRRAGQICAVGLFSCHRHPVFPGCFADVFCLSGPVGNRIEDIADLLDGLTRQRVFRHTGRFRVTPYWFESDAAELAFNLRESGWTITDPEPSRPTGLIDLQRSHDEITQSFSTSARREIRRAERQGVQLFRITDQSGAAEFFDSLNRLRHRRGLRPRDRSCFLDHFQLIHAPGDLGVLISAFHGGDFLGGLLLYRSTSHAMARHFTTEPERLHDLANLRIAPLIWREAMFWAKSRGCVMFDVCGYHPDILQGDPMYAVNKYKTEFAPVPVMRLAEHGKVISVLLHLTGNSMSLTKQMVKRVLGTRKGLWTELKARAQHRNQ